MNLLKHMEAVFIGAVVLAVSSSYVADTLPTAHATPVAAASTAAVSTAAAVPVVVVSAKRMSPQEKLQAARAEAATPASRI